MVIITYKFFFHKSPTIIPVIIPDKCPNIDTFFPFRDGSTTVKIIDNTRVKSSFCTIINSQVIKPNNNPEIPIPHGMEGNIRKIVISSSEAITNRQLMRIINFFVPKVLSIREIEYSPKIFPIK